MILPEKRIQQEVFANITDYKPPRPDGTREFFAFIGFTNGSEIMWSRIFTFDRQMANLLVFKKFSDCFPYVSRMSLQECFD